MSSSPFHALREERRYFREIDNHYHLQLVAQNVQQLTKENARSLSAQMSHARGIIKTVEGLSDEQREAGRRVFDSLNDLKNAIENLAEVEARTTDAVVTLSSIVSRGVQELSEQMWLQRQLLEEVAQTLRRPYEAKVLELRKEADKWLTLGAQSDGRERDENLRDAMRLLRATAENPIGMQDYVTWFQIGWLLWKQENNLAEAQEAFYRAQRLSSATKDAWHINSLRHFAEMQYLQGKCEGAYSTIAKALLIQRTHPLLFDAARYAARSGRQEDCLKLLNECIKLQPTTWNTMLAENDFQDTNALQQPILQFRDKLESDTRHEVQKRLTQFGLLLALVRRVERKADLKIHSGNTVLDQANIDTDLNKTDYLKLLAIRANVIATIERVAHTTKAILKLKIAENGSLEEKTHAQLEELTRSLERRLSEARQEKELAESRVLTAVNHLSLPQKPHLISKKKEKADQSGLGCLLFGIVGVVYFIRTLGGVRYGQIAAVAAFVCTLLIAGFSFSWWLAAPFIALLRWHLKCKELKHRAITEAAERLTEVSGRYLVTIREIEIIRETKVPQLEAQWTVALQCKEKAEEILTFFEKGCTLAAVNHSTTEETRSEI